MIALATLRRIANTALAALSLVLSSFNTLAVLMSCCATNLRSPMIEVVLCGTHLRWG